MVSKIKHPPDFDMAGSPILNLSPLLLKISIKYKNIVDLIHAIISYENYNMSSFHKFYIK